MKKLSFILITSIAVMLLAGCGMFQKAEETMTPNSIVLGEISEIDRNTFTIKELEIGGGRVLTGGATGEGGPQRRIVNGDGEQPADGERRSIRGNDENGELPPGDSNRRIITRQEGAGEEWEIPDGETRRVPRPKYSGTIKTITLPKNIEVKTTVFENGEPVENNLSISDLKNGDVIFISYNEEGKVGEVTLTPQRMDAEDEVAED